MVNIGLEMIPSWYHYITSENFVKPYGGKVKKENLFGELQKKKQAGVGGKY